MEFTLLVWYERLVFLPFVGSSIAAIMIGFMYRLPNTSPFTHSQAIKDLDVFYTNIFRLRCDTKNAIP